MVTPRATMVEVTSVRATVAVIVAARTPEAEAETVVAVAVAETVAAEAEAETVVVAVAVATDACPTEWAMDNRSLLPRDAQATKS